VIDHLKDNEYLDIDLQTTGPIQEEAQEEKQEGGRRKRRMR
jgi:hypothetical protein